MKFERQPTIKETVATKKEKEGDLLFEIKKIIKGVDVSVGIERGKEPITGSVDLVNKRVEARITPEGIRKGFKLFSDFMEKPETKEVMVDMAERMNKYAERKRRAREERRKNKDKETVGEYAKQEGKDEKEVVEEFLNELAREKETKK
jgi:FixJ family two-component response regulator